VRRRAPIQGKRKPPKLRSRVGDRAGTEYRRPESSPSIASTWIEVCCKRKSQAHANGANPSDDGNATAGRRNAARDARQASFFLTFYDELLARLDRGDLDLLGAVAGLGAYAESRRTAKRLRSDCGTGRNPGRAVRLKASSEDAAGPQYSKRKTTAPLSRGHRDASSQPAPGNQPANTKN